MGASRPSLQRDSSKTRVLDVLGKLKRNCYLEMPGIEKETRSFAEKTEKEGERHGPTVVLWLQARRHEQSMKPVCLSSSPLDWEEEIAVF